MNLIQSKRAGSARALLYYAAYHQACMDEESRKRCRRAPCPCAVCKHEKDKDYKTISSHVLKNGVALQHAHIT